jgi:protein phosphatase
MADSGAPSDPSTVEPAEGAFRLRFAAVSDVGRHRKENQDSGYAGDNLLVVADGVGGAAYGDVASATAVHLLRRLDHRPDGEMLPELAGAMHRIHDRLAELVEQDNELEGTSTTVTAALFDGDRLGFAHAGDSRAYLLRGGEIRQITKDHTFVQTLVDEGRITEAEARVHPHRNIILKAVDGVHDTEPDLFYVEAQAGDRLLLCSDGCSGAVEDSDLGRLLAQGTVDGAAGSLVQAALDGGTTDNVTVVVAEIVPADPRPAGARPVDSTSADSDGVVAAPLMVGAAAVSPRRGGMLARALFRGRLDGSRGDTGELEPVLDEPLDPEELRYAPRPPRRGRVWRRLLLILVPLLLIVAGLVGAYSWSQNQYYVAADGPDVAIFRGVQVDIPGVDLSSTYEVSDVKLADLPPVNQGDVKAGIGADSLSDAHRIVDDLSGLVATCPPAQQHHHHKHHQQSGKHHAATSQHHKKRTGSTRQQPKAGATQTHKQKSGPSASPSPSPSASGSGSGSGSRSGSTNCTSGGTP